MSEPRLTNRTPYVVLAIVVLLAIAAAVGWFVFARTEEPPPVVKVEPKVVDAGVPEQPPEVSLADGDALLKDSAGGLSGDPQLARWLAQPDIVRRLVGALVQVADGESPRGMLGFLAVSGEFSVTEVKDKKNKKKKKTFMDPKSAARYDAVTKVIGSVDPAAAAKLYVKTRPFADRVLREIAPGNTTLEAVLQKAVDTLAAVPLVDAPLELEPLHQGIGYRCADPRLEALSAAQKHLLRMGPTNARVVVDKLKAFRAATLAP